MELNLDTKKKEVKVKKWQERLEEPGLANEWWEVVRALQQQDCNFWQWQQAENAELQNHSSQKCTIWWEADDSKD